MASVAYVTTFTYASNNDQWAHPACALVSLSKTKPYRFSSVQLRRSVSALSFNVYAYRMSYLLDTAA